MLWWVALILIVQVVLCFKWSKEDTVPLYVAKTAVACALFIPPSAWFFVHFWDTLVPWRTT